MDSDTFLAPDALYNDVQNFSSRNVGAVCGHGKVHHRSENALTKMQDAWYDGMFTVFKGAESVFGMVTCCSGLLSFYRRKSITGMMESWASETFLGIPVKAGEDRALTNIVLEEERTLFTRAMRSLIQLYRILSENSSGNRFVGREAGSVVTCKL